MAMRQMAGSAARQDHRVDVCVVGGGMAGLCAALAAARHGARTLLVQDRPVLGGNGSSEVRMHICGAHGDNNKETGLLEELQLDNAWRNGDGNWSVWDSVLYGAARFQPNLTLLLNTACTDCRTERAGEGLRITAIRAWGLTSQTWHDIEAGLFIDCSGDSILAASGAEHRWGRESSEEFGEDIEPPAADGKTMGNTILIQLRRTDEAQRFTPPPWAYRFESPADFRFRMDGVKGQNFWWIELGGLDDTIHDADAIRDELLRCAWGIWDYIKNVSPARDQAAHWALHWIGSLPGKRENRRYVGDHILTQHDVRSGGRFDDVVAFGGWTMDDHHPAGLLYPGRPTLFHPAPSPFGIPYRSLYSRNVENLLFAGRNISVTHAALSATRVMATCAVIGQAVGSAAALCVAKGVTPRGLYPAHIGELQQQLMADDAWLPGQARAIDPLTQAARLGGEQAVLRTGHDRPIGEQSNAWTGQPGSAIALEWDSPTAIGGARLVFDSDLLDLKRMPHEYPARLAVPASLVRAFRLEARQGGQWRTVYRNDDNHQRLVRLPLNLQADALRLIPEATWGADAVRVFAFEATRTAPEHLPALPDRPRWADIVARTDPADLVEPEKEQQVGR